MISHIHYEVMNIPYMNILCSNVVLCKNRDMRVEISILKQLHGRLILRMSTWRSFDFKSYIASLKNRLASLALRSLGCHSYSLS